jgi:hypothetical protein
MLLQHKGNTTGKLAFKPEEKIGGTSLAILHRRAREFNLQSALNQCRGFSEFAVCILTRVFFSFCSPPH